MRIMITGPSTVGASASVVTSLRRFWESNLVEEDPMYHISVDSKGGTFPASLNVAVLVTMLEPPPGKWNLIIVFTDTHAEQLRSRFPSASVSVCSIPVTASSISSMSKDRLLYSSRISSDLLRLLQHWSFIFSRVGWYLSLTHDVRSWCRTHRGSLQQQFSLDIERLVLQPGVIIHGPLSWEALSRLRGLSHAVMVPDTNGLPCLSTLEAQHCGIPAIPIGLSKEETWDVLMNTPCYPPNEDHYQQFVSTWSDILEKVGNPIVIQDESKSFWRPPVLIP